jgi:STIP1 family protein 1
VHDCVGEAIGRVRAVRGPAKVPDYFCCQITMDLMLDPVTTPCGITYEKAALREHLAKVGEFDPVTRRPLQLAQAVPNLALRDAARAFLDERPWAFEAGL